jgi:hypothetical protein
MIVSSHDFLCASVWFCFHSNLFVLDITRGLPGGSTPSANKVAPAKSPHEPPHRAEFEWLSLITIKILVAPLLERSLWRTILITITTWLIRRERLWCQSSALLCFHDHLPFLCRFVLLVFSAHSQVDRLFL